MIKALDLVSNAYVQIVRSLDCMKSYRILENHTYLTSNIQDPELYFLELHHFSISYRNAERTVRSNIEAIELEVLLPEGLSFVQQQKFASDYATEAFAEMDYIAWLRKKGNGYYINYLISERKYIPEGQEMIWKAPADIYQKQTVKGKVFCKANDPDAVLIEAKGAIRKTEIVCFGNKNRYFTGCKEEFERLITSLKHAVVVIAEKYKKVIHRAFIQKINIKKANGNVYWYRNIMDLNRTFQYFESVINTLENNIILGYMQDSLSDFQKIKYRMLNRARNLRFRYGKITLPFHYTLRRNQFRENIAELIKKFDDEVSGFYESLYVGD